MFSRKRKATQPEFWVATLQLLNLPKRLFISKLEETLESFGFAEKVPRPTNNSILAGLNAID
jgi:hypothetical protein